MSFFCLEQFGSVIKMCYGWDWKGILERYHLLKFLFFLVSFEGNAIWSLPSLTAFISGFVDDVKFSHSEANGPELKTANMLHTVSQVAALGVKFAVYAFCIQMQWCSVLLNHIVVCAFVCVCVLCRKVYRQWRRLGPSVHLQYQSVVLTLAWAAPRHRLNHQSSHYRWDSNHTRQSGDYRWDTHTQYLLHSASLYSGWAVSLKEERLEGHRSMFLQARCPSCRPTTDNKCLKGTRTIDSSHGSLSFLLR